MMLREKVYKGWNSDYKECEIIFSGQIIFYTVSAKHSKSKTWNPIKKEKM